MADDRETLELDTLAAAPLHLEAQRSELTLTVLCHPNLARIGQRAHCSELEAGAPLALSRQAPEFVGAGGAGRPLADPFVSRRPLILKPERGGLALEGAKWRLDGRPARRRERLSRADLERGARIALADRVLLLLHRTRGEPHTAPELGIAGASDVAEALRRAAAELAGASAPVLITGESGAGKERVARAVHRASDRGGPWVAVDMAALTPARAPGVLFGDGGAFERARGGTLFLDEIAETPLEVQPVLLRALDRFGDGDAPRVLAATNADPDARLAQGRLRADLLYRIRALSLRVPPLRERPEDIPLLLARFLHEALGAGADHLLSPAPREPRPWLGAALIEALMGWSWPGNVRELRGAAAAIALHSRARDRAALPPDLAARLASTPGEASAPAAAPSQAPARKKRPSEIGPDELRAALRRNRWRLNATARELGIAKNSLAALIERAPDIRRARDLSDAEIREALERNGGDVWAAAEELEVSVRGLQMRVQQG